MNLWDQLQETTRAIRAKVSWRPASLEEILKVAAKAEPKLTKLISKVIERL